jgi:hypothetical protein
MTAPDQCCINVKRLLSIRRRAAVPHRVPTQKGVGGARFRTIQVGPKDLPATPSQVEPAVD